MQLSCCDCAFPRLSHECALSVVADLGFAAVDVCALAGYEHTPPHSVVADPRAAADAVLRRLEWAELAVSDVFAILSDPFEALAVNHPDAEVRRESLRQFEQVVAFARRLDAPGITVLPGMPFEGVEDDRGLELAAAELRRRAEIAGAADLALSFEPHIGSIVPTPARTLELLAAADGVTVTLDLSHFTFQGIPQADAEALIPRTRHVHLRPAAPGDMQARAREGTIDFERLLERLADAGYRGYLAIEYIWEEWMGCNDVDCVSETAELRDRINEQCDRMGAERRA